MYPQYDTQQYVNEKTVGDDSTKVYDYSTPERKIAYLVMEYVDADPIPAPPNK